MSIFMCLNLHARLLTAKMTYIRHTLVKSFLSKVNGLTNQKKNTILKIAIDSIRFPTSKCILICHQYPLFVARSAISISEVSIFSTGTLVTGLCSNVGCFHEQCYNVKVQTLMRICAQHVHVGRLPTNNTKVTRQMESD